MKVEVISCMYNEQFLAPFFCKHYEWADRITVLLDTATTDKTEEIINGFANVVSVPFEMPDGMNDGLKSIRISEFYQASDSDWVIIADADEFIFITREDIESVGGHTMARVALYDVFRHTTESDLDSSLPVRDQRSHGCLDERYIKPSIVRGGMGFSFGPGHHHLGGIPVVYPLIFKGAHWANADKFCIERRIKGRRDRQSAENRMFGWSTQNWGVTEVSILQELKNHENDPQLWEVL